MANETQEPRKGPRFLSVRETDIFRRQIDDLVRHFGENQSRVIIRAIAEAHYKYIKSSQIRG